jgi:anti-sigma factor ChrR (cupin superfamily)
MSEKSINGNLDEYVAIQTASMPWSPSPSPSVWRKRLHRVGPAESGQVTSIVRYDPRSKFPAHEHPDGEEILVLDGVFTDDRGDWPKGTYLLNPEGYRHAPSSRDGCVLFVKLRQFPGLDRRQVAVDTAALDWEPSDIDGIEIKPLYSQPGYGDSTALERWPANLAIARRDYAEGAELFVIEGSFRDETGEHNAGTWMRFPAGAGHSPETPDGCTIYLKHGGNRYLNCG